MTPTDPVAGRVAQIRERLRLGQYHAIDAMDVEFLLAALAAPPGEEA